jgi:hypothetical protein
MKTSKRHLYGLITTLFLLGIGLFCYRHFALDVPLTDTEKVNSWMVEANLRFNAERNAPVKASFTIPYMPPYVAILDEYFVAQNYGVTTNLNGYNRRVIWSLRRSSGTQSLYYRAILRETDNHDSYLSRPGKMKSHTLTESQKTALDSVIGQSRQSSADIQTFAQSAIKELNKGDGSAKLLVGNDASDAQIVSAAVDVLNRAKIDAMPVQGFYLAQQSKVSFKLFLAVYNGKEWVYINPRTGSAGLPKDFLIWQYGKDPMFDVMGGKHPQFTLTVSPTPVNALSLAKARGLQTDSQLLRFSLLQLPINVQETYKILLMVPIGAFIILMLRNFIGLRTFGTFMPVLIALAFRETHVIWGMLLFIFIVSFGLLARFYLDQLRLLLVPRLAAILTVVIMLMIFISVMSQKLDLDSGLSVALFPMIILTMTIERMCIMWDERGASDAIKSGAGSLLAALVAFAAMSNAHMQYLMFAFPELLLVLLAFILWFGQYRGYRLVELVRFKALAGKS